MIYFAVLLAMVVQLRLLMQNQIRLLWAIPLLYVLMRMLIPR